MTLWNSLFSAKRNDAPQQQQNQQQLGNEETMSEKAPREGGGSESSTPADGTASDNLTEPRIDIHLLASGDGAIISVVPAEKPPKSVSASGHVPVDIVLVIDVSGSMGDAAPAPAGAGDTSGTREDFGLSVLDLTKHAARTIMETLNEDDRLAIVTFSNKATVLQPLISMNATNKKSTARKIDGMRPLATTNMWQGMMHGLDQFKRNGAAELDRVPALMVLTDGQPNFGDPPKGYVTKLREMAPLPASIHTFGFGYQLDSCLLKSVAEVGSGNFSFIPDAGMIGTVFIHAVAHLQTTYATRCTLEIKTPLSLKLRTTHGDVLNGTMTGDASAQITATHHVLNLALGNLQYGQPRDIYLECRSRMGNRWSFDQAVTASRAVNKNFDPKTQAVLSAKLEFSLVKSKPHTVTADKSIVRPAAPAKQAAGSSGEEQAQPTMSVGTAAYHKSRAEVSEFLASFFKPHPHAGYVLAFDVIDVPVLRNHLIVLSASLPARKHLASSSYLSSATEQRLQSLLLDVDGQMTIALSNSKYFTTWAVPYFASLSHAHSRQLCNSFKDPGLQGYNDSAFFRRCRDELDTAFERIEPPTPSRFVATSPTMAMAGAGAASHAGPGGPPPAYTPHSAATGSSFGSSVMARYNDVDASCFAGSTLVQLPPNGYGKHHRRALPISSLRAGMRVETPLGPRAVRHVLRTPVRDAALCRVGGGARSAGDGRRGGGVLVTAWHPICITPPRPARTSTSSEDDNGEGFPAEWWFPADSMAHEDDVVRYTGGVYSVMLEPDADPRAHAILVSSAGSDGGQQSEEELEIWGVTLGHGITVASSVLDVRAHAFFGDYAAVEKALLGLAAAERRRHVIAATAAVAVLSAVGSGENRKKKTRRARGVVSSAGVARDLDTGLVRGFRPL